MAELNTGATHAVKLAEEVQNENKPKAHKSAVAREEGEPVVASATGTLESVSEVLASSARFTENIGGAFKNLDELNLAIQTLRMHIALLGGKEFEIPINNVEPSILVHLSTNLEDLSEILGKASQISTKVRELTEGIQDLYLSLEATKRYFRWMLVKRALKRAIQKA